jgi:hypothetical protein
VKTLGSRGRECQLASKSRDESSSHNPQKDVARWAWAAVAGALILVLVGLGYFLYRGGPANDEPQPIEHEIIAEFSGDSSESTDDFEVDEGWQIHWQNSGSFAVSVEGDEDLGPVIEQEEAGSGVFAPPGSGTFRLEVEADDAWTVWIIAGD